MADRRWTTRLAVLLMGAALLLAACGGGADAPATVGDAQSPTAVTDPAAAVAAAERPATDTAEPADTGPANPAPPDAPSTEVAQTPPPPAPLTIVLESGHGAADPGAAAFGIVEAESNLEMSQRVEALLTELGFRVVLTRVDDGPAVGFPDDRDTANQGAGRVDRQARVDLANANTANLFLSIHSNAAASPGLNGVEAWYDPDRGFGEENLRFAGLVTDHVVAALAELGHVVTNRGPQNDSCWRVFGGVCRPLFVLGPARSIDRAELEQRGFDPAILGFAPDQQVLTTRATEMPAALAELLFVTHPSDVALLHDDDARQAMAQGLVDAILAFFNGRTTR